MHRTGWLNWVGLGSAGLGWLTIGRKDRVPDNTVARPAVGPQPMILPNTTAVLRESTRTSWKHFEVVVSLALSYDGESSRLKSKMSWFRVRLLTRNTL